MALVYQTASVPQRDASDKVDHTVRGLKTGLWPATAPEAATEVTEPRHINRNLFGLGSGNTTRYRRLPASASGGWFR